MFPNDDPTQVQYRATEYQERLIADFRGGLNLTDPGETLPENQFTQMTNLLLTRRGVLKNRPPYRPYSFQSNPAQTQLPSSTEYPTRILDYKVIQAEVTGWSYEGEIHVIACELNDSYFAVYAIGALPDDWVTDGTYTLGQKVKYGSIFYECISGHTDVSGDKEPPNVTYWEESTPWVQLWKSSADCTGVSIVPFIVNKAVDVLIYPDDTNPERYSFKNTTAALTTTDVGLTKPVTGAFTKGTWAEVVHAQAIDLQAALNVYYRFSYWYDDKNETTRYGESSIGNQLFFNPGTTRTRALNLPLNNVSIPDGVSKIRIYRANNGSTKPPWRYIGETAVNRDGDGLITSIDTYQDQTPWGQEGVEDIPAGSDPSRSGNEYAILKPTNIGGTILGFDASMPHKAIWSDPGYPDVMNPLNFDYLEGDGRGAVAFNRQVYVFTATSVYQKATVVDPAYRVSNVGCLEGKSIQNVGTGICWLGTDTVYFADFVQQYGSKGDFPKDIGHPISVDALYADPTATTDSTFYEQRYYLSYHNTRTQTRKTFVFDVDFQAWTESTVQHEAFAVGINKMYTCGCETVAGVDYRYVFEHDYFATVAIGTWSIYAGVDQHDYLIIGTDGTAYEQSNDILVLMTRDFVRLSGLYRKTFISSLILFAEGDAVDVDVSFVNESDVQRTVNFTLSVDPESSFPFYYDDPASLMSNNADTAASSAYRGYVALSTAKLRKHVRINRSVKDYSFTLQLQADAARSLRINLLGIRFKPLPTIA